MRRIVLTTGFVLVFYVYLATAQAQQPAPAIDWPLQFAICQEQLTDVRAAVKDIHQPIIAYQSEAVMTLNRKQKEATEKQKQDAETINALRKELATLKGEDK